MAKPLAVHSFSSTPFLSHVNNSVSNVSGQSSVSASGLLRQVLIRKENYRTLRLAERRNCAVRAGLGNENGKNEPSSMSFTSDDWQYVGKLFAACIAGAVLIKYGSVLLPRITQPNLVQALTMITTPVLVSVAVLLAASPEQMSDE